MPRCVSGFVVGLTLLSAACGRAVPATPLSRAAAAGGTDVVARLLTEGADPNQHDQNGFSALGWAAQGGHAAVIKHLVIAGADPNIHDRNENRWTPLLHAIHKNQHAAIRTLLDLGANPSSDSPYGNTPLIMAAAYGSSNVVGWLLDAGADPYATQKNGENALAAAVGRWSDPDRWTVGHCQTDTVRLLLARAPRLRVPESVSGSLSMWAARVGNCSEVLALLDQQQKTPVKAAHEPR